MLSIKHGVQDDIVIVPYTTAFQRISGRTHAMVINVQVYDQASTETSRVMTFLLAAIAGISLFVGGIGIMNVMLVSVSERTREVGLRLSMGARSRDVLSQFLVEAVALCLLDGIGGILVGIAATEVIARYAEWPALFSTEAMMVAVSVSAAVGLFFGFYPAWKASRLDPIVALRTE